MGTYGKAKNSAGEDVQIYIPGKQEAYESSGDTRYNKKAHKAEEQAERLEKGYRNLAHKQESRYTTTTDRQIASNKMRDKDEAGRRKRAFE